MVYAAMKNRIILHKYKINLPSNKYLYYYEYRNYYYLFYQIYCVLTAIRRRITIYVAQISTESTRCLLTIAQ